MPTKRRAKANKDAGPFKPAPESLAIFYETLSPRHVYIAHVDSKPRYVKRKSVSVPVLMNVVVAGLFVWRS